MDKCSLRFEWKTSFLCSKKVMAFNTLLCTATLLDYQNDIDGPKIINMTNILNFHEVSFNLKIITNNINIFKNSCT